MFEELYWELDGEGFAPYCASSIELGDGWGGGLEETGIGDGYGNGTGLKYGDGFGYGPEHFKEGTTECDF
jgi:hypothetical protein